MIGTSYIYYCFYYYYSYYYYCYYLNYGRAPKHNAERTVWTQEGGERRPKLTAKDTTHSTLICFLCRERGERQHPVILCSKDREFIEIMGSIFLALILPTLKQAYGMGGSSRNRNR